MTCNTLPCTRSTHSGNWKDAPMLPSTSSVRIAPFPTPDLTQVQAPTIADHPAAVQSQQQSWRRKSPEHLASVFSLRVHPLANQGFATKTAKMFLVECQYQVKVASLPRLASLRRTLPPCASGEGSPALLGEGICGFRRRRHQRVG